MPLSEDVDAIDSQSVSDHPEENTIPNMVANSSVNNSNVLINEEDYESSSESDVEDQDADGDYTPSSDSESDQDMNDEFSEDDIDEVSSDGEISDSDNENIEEVTRLWSDIVKTGEDELKNDKIKVDIENPSPEEIFNHFITPDIIDLIVLETNRYAEQYKKDKKLKKNISVQKMGGHR